MSIASQDTYLNTTTPLSVIGTGGGSGGVNNVFGGANLSTVGATTGDVTLALLPNVANLSSLSFSAGGSITGVSTINGVVPGAAVVPGNLLVSTLTVGASTISGVSTINGVPYVAGGAVPANLTASTLTLGGAASISNVSSIGFGGASIFTSTVQGLSTLYIERTGSNNSIGDIVFSQDAGPRSIVQVRAGLPNAVTYSQVAVANDRVEVAGLSTVYIVAPQSVEILGPTSISTLNAAAVNVSSINSAAYPPAALPNATLSTLALSTLGVPVALFAASTMQTVNSQIGNLRIQSGSVEATVAGVVVTFQTPFGGNPVVTTGVVSVSGTNVNAVVTSAGTSQATFSVDTVGALPAVPVTYTAIGLA